MRQYVVKVLVVSENDKPPVIAQSYGGMYIGSGGTASLRGHTMKVVSIKRLPVRKRSRRSTD